MKQYQYLLPKIKEHMDEARFHHTLAVADEAHALARYYGLSEEKQDKLYLAGLLHDITKSCSFEEHLALAKTLNISLSNEDIASPPILHALTGAALCRKEFSDVTDTEIISAIAAHTTGHAEMTLFEKLLYLADFIEPTRKHTVCQNARKAFYDDLALTQDRLVTLNRHLLAITEGTKQHILSNHYPLHPKTVETIESLHKELAK